MPATSFANTSLTREKIVTIARALPADLRVLSRLSELLRDPNANLGDIADLLKRDVTLAAKVVRIGNSPVFGGGRCISTAEEAVNRVGFGEVLKLVGTATAGRLSENSLQCYNIGANLLRDNMLYGALAAEALAVPAGIDPRLAYNAGLLRAVGLMVLDRAGRRDATTSPFYTAARWPDYATWETNVFGISSCEVTAVILDEWQFPAEMTEAIRVHYLTQPSDHGNKLAALLNVANSLAQRVSRSFVGEEAWWAISPEKLEAAGVTLDDFEPAVVTTEAAFEAANRALAI